MGAAPCLWCHVLLHMEIGSLRAKIIMRLRAKIYSLGLRLISGEKGERGEWAAPRSM